MTYLSIVSGPHSGENVKLCPGRHAIRPAGTVDENQPDANSIGLVDWLGAPVYLEVGAGLEEVHIISHEDGAEERKAWNAGEEREFNGITLVLASAAERINKNNEENSKNTLKKKQPALSQLRAGVLNGVTEWLFRGLAVGATSLIALSAIYGNTSAKESKQVHRRSHDKYWLSATIKSQGLNDINVATENGRLILDGLIQGNVQEAALKTIVGEYALDAPIPLLEYWTTVENIVSSIDAALRTTGVRSEYVGKGEFRVFGEAADVNAVNATLNRLEVDLGRNVRSIKSSITSVVHKPALSSVLVVEGVNYQERTDGTKIFKSGR